jgi:GTP-binding protein
MGLPVVTIVGRPNVGKSSLLNCLAGRRISIVDGTPGVTRDRVSTTVSVGEGDDARYVELIDTGGMGVEDVDRLTDHVENQIAYAIHQASLVLFVVDARDGIVPLDNHVAEKLRRIGAPVILVANKIDQTNLVAETGELYALGFGEPVEISAIHNQGMAELVDRMAEVLAKSPPGEMPDETLKLAIVGKRNAGKSTLTNALAGEQRVIVSETPGTTRDSVDVTVDIAGQRITLIDTAGLRRKKSLANDIEFYSQHRAMRSVRRADVVAMVIDASVPVSKVDKNLAGIIQDEFKPVVIVVNKWDLASGVATADDYAEYFGKEFPSLSFAPISMTSASQGLNVEQTIRLATHLHAQASYRVQTAELNEALEAILEKRGPSHKGGTRPPKIYYASQVAVNPPTIVCFVNDVRSFDQSYQRFLVNQFREYLPYPEVPIRLILRPRRRET